MIRKCSFHFLLVSYVLFKIVKNIISSFAFFSLQIRVFAPKRVPLEAEIGMF